MPPESSKQIEKTRRSSEEEEADETTAGRPLLLLAPLLLHASRRHPPLQSHVPIVAVRPRDGRVGLSEHPPHMPPALVCERQTQEHHSGAKPQ